MGSRTHTGFIGEQTTSHTETDCFLNGHTDDTTHNGLGSECAYKDRAKCRQNVAGIHENSYQRTNNVQTSHDRHDLLSHRSNALHAAQENERRNSCHHDANCQLRNAESGIECIADGVRLHHVAHEAQCQNNGNCKETGHDLAENALECSLDVIHGTAGNRAVFVYSSILLCQHGFAIDGCHTEESRDPHPEHGTGTTCNQGRCATGNVTGTDLCRNGSCQSLERTHTVLAGRFTL